MVVDWRAMFGHYVDRVGENEGVTFLSSTDWTTEEWKALTDLVGAELNDFPANQSEEARLRALAEDEARMAAHLEAANNG